jgi:hypothetical protein
MTKRRDPNRTATRRAPAPWTRNVNEARRRVDDIDLSAPDGATLRSLAAAKRQLEKAIDAGIMQMRAAGASWGEIANPLGVSYQAVQQRHRRLTGINITSAESRG